MTAIRGILPALLTPFDENFRPYERGISMLLDHLLQGGVDGLFILGTTGLGPILCLEERMKVAEVAVTTTSGKVARIVHIGSLSVEDIFRLARHAENIGAEAVACLTPFYYRLDEESLVNFFKTLSERASLPIFMYNIPQNTGYNAGPMLVSEISKRVEGVIGIKDSSGNLAQLVDLLELTSEGFIIFNGEDDIILSSLLLGVSGSISAIANIVPREVKGIDVALSSGLLKDAKSLQRKVSFLKRAMGGKTIPAIYSILNHLGIPVGRPKPPIQPLSSEEERRVIEKVSGILEI